VVPKEGAERVYQTARRLTAGEIRNRRVITITEEEDSFGQAVELVLRHDINSTRIPVVRNGIPARMNDLPPRSAPIVVTA
jgi:hypothetical protein